LALFGDAGGFEAPTALAVLGVFAVGFFGTRQVITLPRCSIQFKRKQNVFWQSCHLAGTMGFSRKQCSHFFFERAIFQLGRMTESGPILAALRAPCNVFVALGKGLTVTHNQGGRSPPWLLE
jgi:hypothetical protein